MIDLDKIKELFVEFLIENHETDFLTILKSPETTINYPIYVSFLDLICQTEIRGFNAAVFLSIQTECLLKAQKQIEEKYSSSHENLIFKNRICIRFESTVEDEGICVKYPNCSHINRLICFKGTVTKVFSSRMIESSQIYVCTKCGYEMTSKLDYSLQDLISKPSRCLKKECTNDKFSLKVVEKNFKNVVKDYQEIKVQEKLDLFSAGSVPRSMIVILEDDLVDYCKPGDDVTIVAKCVARLTRFTEGQREHFDIILHANNIKINNDNQFQIQITGEKEMNFRNFWSSYKSRPLTGRNIILGSLCPKLYGMYVVKLAVSLVIVGGVSRNDPNGTKVRGDSHLLLAGDPGTGKSQFLKYANKIIPKSILTNGIGSSSAGLTATASRDGGLWHLEAGALVLADGGICCVDEFNCMKETEKMSMLEAMEQQSISVAKAGIVCKLRTQCAVLAACNPKGHYDQNQPATINLAMSSPLLSRFDIVLLLLDTPNKEWDNLAATYLLEGIDLLRDLDMRKVNWDFEQLQLYLNFVRSLEPQLTDEANQVIIRYYQLQRKSDERNAARTTVRMLESVIRLSQAHAKLMLRDEVLIMDAIVAITLVECSLNKTASFGNVNILHTSFPEDAESEYRNQVELILTRLGLTDLMHKELDFVTTNYEPFNSENTIAKPNMKSAGFDIISQMAPEMCSQNTSKHPVGKSILNDDEKYKRQGNRTMNTSSRMTNSDIGISQMINKLPTQPGCQSTSRCSQNTTTTTTVDTSVICEEENKENDSEKKRQQIQSLARKRKADFTMILEESRESNQNVSVAYINNNNSSSQKRFAHDPNPNKTNLNSSTVTQAQSQQAKSTSASQQPKQPSQKINLDNLNFDDNDLKFDDDFE